MNTAVLPPKAYAEILTLNVMVLGGGALGRWSGHGGKTLRNWINVLIKRDRRACFLSLRHVRTQWEDGHLQSRKRAINRYRVCQWLHARLPSLQNREKSISVVHKPPGPCWFVRAAQLTKTNTFRWHEHISPCIFINDSQNSTFYTWKGALCIVWTHSVPAINDIQVFGAIWKQKSVVEVNSLAASRPCMLLGER